MPGLSGGRPLIEIGLISVFLIVLSTSVLFAEAQALRKGDKGQNVGAVQFLLRFRGIAGVRADRVFSENTESCVLLDSKTRELKIPLIENVDLIV
jgi:peptidoglycan hydrolase-like protein with peptidoglycan-binding domain